MLTITIRCSCACLTAGKRDWARSYSIALYPNSLLYNARNLLEELNIETFVAAIVEAFGPRVVLGLVHPSEYGSSPVYVEVVLGAYLGQSELDALFSEGPDYLEKLLRVFGQHPMDVLSLLRDELPQVSNDKLWIRHLQPWCPFFVQIRVEPLHIPWGQVLPFHREAVQLTGHNLVVENISHLKERSLLPPFFILEHSDHSLQVLFEASLEIGMDFLLKNFVFKD